MTATKAVSASGLFRATGNKSKPTVIKTLDGYERVDAALRREKDDFYPTPLEPILSILNAECDHLKEFDDIWEPAAGNGVMVRELEKTGFRVFKSDLVDRGCGAEIKSFYDYQQAPARAAFTNPPFCECNARDGKGHWIWHAMHRHWA